MLAILIEIKVIELYKKNCWDVITLLMILTSVATVSYTHLPYFYPYEIITREIREIF